MRSRSSRTTRQAAARDGSASRCCLYLRPSALEMIERQAFRDALKAPDRSRQAYFGLFPFRWKDNWKQSFDALRGGRLFVAPFCRRSFLTRHRGKPLIADKVANWDFQRIVTCHFDSPIQAGPRQFRQAFFLEKPSIAVSSFASGCAPPRKILNFSGNSRRA